MLTIVLGDEAAQNSRLLRLHAVASLGLSRDLAPMLLAKLLATHMGRLHLLGPR